MLTYLFVLAGLLLLFAVPIHAATPGPAASGNPDHEGFQKLATAYGLGGVLNSVVGPGPEPGSERLYLSYIYADDTVDLVSVDPATAAYHVFESPARSQWGAWALAVGPDGNIYVGTLPGAHLFRLNPRTGDYVDLGRPAPTEQYIWQLATGSDNRLYGCTYPSARLVRYDPATGKAEDLGRMDETEQYARYVAASNDGFVYTGIGMGRSHLVAFEIASGRHRDILPPEYQRTGSAEVHRAASGKVYGSFAGQHFRLDGWDAVAIPASEDPGAAPRDRLSDGRVISVADHQVHVSAAGGTPAARFPFGYPGRALPIFRLGIGPDGLVYASSILPIHFLQLHPETGVIKDLGGLGGGEFYSFLTHGDRLLMAAYSGKAPLMSYDPRSSFKPGIEPGSNPLLVKYPGQDSAWRPQAMINGPDGKVYLGAVAGYGKLGGPLARWDTVTGHVDSYDDLVADQSVVSLAAAGSLLVGGTTVEGGGGSHPTATEARLFLWDPVSRQKVFEMTPVPGAREITDLTAAPGGLVYGIAGGKTLFAFDPVGRKLVRSSVLPFGGVIYNSLAPGPGHRLWGLARAGIFTIDPETGSAALVAEAPEPITAGFALVGRTIYFASGAAIYRCQIGQTPSRPQQVGVP